MGISISFHNHFPLGNHILIYLIIYLRSNLQIIWHVNFLPFVSLILINQFFIYLLYKKSLSYENNNCAAGRRRKTASAVCRKSRTPSAGTTAAILHRKYTLQSLIWMKVNFFLYYIFFLYIFFFYFYGDAYNSYTTRL